MEVLSTEQTLKTLIWLKEHRKHVYNMVFNSEKEYPPSDNEDKNNPALWKPEHWKWFLNHKANN